MTLETTDAQLLRDLRALHSGAHDDIVPLADVVLAKVFGWRAAVDFVVAARASGWAVCEMIPRPKSDAYLFCAHSSGRCRATGIVLWDKCPYCAKQYIPRRKDQHACGRARCRQRRRRLPEWKGG